MRGWSLGIDLRHFKTFINKIKSDYNTLYNLHSHFPVINILVDVVSQSNVFSSSRIQVVKRIFDGRGVEALCLQ